MALGTPPLVITPMFVDVAAALGIRGIVHTDCKSTCEQLCSFELRNALVERLMSKSDGGWAAFSS